MRVDLAAAKTPRGMLRLTVLRGIHMRSHGTAFLLGVAIVVASVFAAPETAARDTKNMWPIADAMNSGSAKARLDAGIKFYFGDSEHPPVAKSFGVFMSNKKTEWRRQRGQGSLRLDLPVRDDFFPRPREANGR